MEKEDSRYPYTYAADYLRMFVGDDYGKGLISRSAAAAIHHEISRIIGMNEEEMAKKIADKYLETQS